MSELVVRRSRVAPLVAIVLCAAAAMWLFAQHAHGLPVAPAFTGLLLAQACCAWMLPGYLVPALLLMNEQQAVRAVFIDVNRHGLLLWCLPWPMLVVIAQMSAGAQAGPQLAVTLTLPGVLFVLSASISLLVMRLPGTAGVFAVTTLQWLGLVVLLVLYQPLVQALSAVLEALI